MSISDSAVARRSARRNPWQIVYSRDIGPEDLALLHSSNLTPSDPKAPLAKLRDRHHFMAQRLAEGADVIEVARLTGFSVQRLRTLTNDPAFGELMVHYAELRTHRDLDIDMSIRHVATTATEILQERMEEEPDSFSNEELRKLRNDSLDRIGKGPTSKRSIEIHDPRGVLSEIRELMSAESQARIVPRDAIEVDYHEVLTDDEESPPVDEAASSGVCGDGAVLDGAEAQGQSSGGNPLSGPSP